MRTLVRPLPALLALALAATPAHAVTPIGGTPAPLAHTFSIVARDPVTGDFGVAVQSHWFQVGTVVPWAEAGVGAVASQSVVRPAYGVEGLQKMAKGISAQEALKSSLDADPERDSRQVAMVDRTGHAAAWTGAKCIAEAGHHVGDGYSVQANLMGKATVWPAMAKAYEAAKGDFAERLLAALDAAQKEGGDIRGMQSAALIIVKAEKTAGGAEPWNDTLVNLRVDDNPDPLAELRRLYRLHRAYEAMNAGDNAFAKNDVKEALRLYSQGTDLAPEIVELPFWKAVTLFASGREDEALPIFRDVFAKERRWVELVPRLVPAGMLPDDREKIARILEQAPGAEIRLEKK